MKTNRIKYPTGTALITGASSGIGRDMARELSSLGWKLILVARRYDRLTELAESLGTPAKCIAADLTEKSECERVYDAVKYDGIDLLINNAGFGLCGEFVSFPLERELEMIDINIRAVHVLTKLFLNDFIGRGSGRILNVASAAGFMAGPGMAVYYATKNYVLRLSEGIYEELRRTKSNVGISVFCPGPVKTEFDEKAGVQFGISGLDSRYVAKYAIKYTLRGKLLIVPGVAAKMGVFFRRFVPEKLLLRIVYNIQKRKRYR